MNSFNFAVVVELLELSQPYLDCLCIFISHAVLSKLFYLSFSVPSTRTDIKPSFWCVVCRQNGALEIYSVPEFKLVFCVRNFAFAPKVLVDSGSIG